MGTQGQRWYYSSSNWPDNYHTVLIGNYVYTKPLPTRIRCKAYDSPPVFDQDGTLIGGGNYICTIDPGTFLGPVEWIMETHGYSTILVRGYWINISHRRTVFAKLVREEDVMIWEDNGWEHDPIPPVSDMAAPAG